MDTIYRFGREEDEVMGIKFSKEYTLHKAQVTPPLKEKRTLSKVQEKLINKLGSDACAFTFQFPDTSPSSVTVQSGEEQPVSKPLGVEYRIRTYVAETVDEQPRKRSMVNLVIKKVRDFIITQQPCRRAIIRCRVIYIYIYIFFLSIFSFEI